MIKIALPNGKFIETKEAVNLTPTESLSIYEEFKKRGRIRGVLGGALAGALTGRLPGGALTGAAIGLGLGGLFGHYRAKKILGEKGYGKAKEEALRKMVVTRSLAA